MVQPPARNLVLAAADAVTDGNVNALARLISTPERTIRAWMDGTNRVPGAALALLCLLVEYPILRTSIEAYTTRRTRKP